MKFVLCFILILSCAGFSVIGETTKIVITDWEKMYGLPLGLSGHYRLVGDTFNAFIVQEENVDEVIVFDINSAMPRNIKIDRCKLMAEGARLGISAVSDSIKIPFFKDTRKRFYQITAPFTSSTKGDYCK